EVALHRALRSDELNAALQGRTPVDAHDIGAGLPHQGEQVGGSHAEVDARYAQLTGRGQHALRVGHDVLDVVLRGERPGPGVEELHRGGAGVDLDLEVGGRDLADLAH